MVTKKQKYYLKSEGYKLLMKEFDVSKAQISRVLNLDNKGKFAQYILKRAIELGAKKQTITIITEEEE